MHAYAATWKLVFVFVSFVVRIQAFPVTLARTLTLPIQTAIFRRFRPSLQSTHRLGENVHFALHFSPSVLWSTSTLTNVASFASTVGQQQQQKEHRIGVTSFNEMSEFNKLHRLGKLDVLLNKIRSGDTSLLRSLLHVQHSSLSEYELNYILPRCLAVMSRSQLLRFWEDIILLQGEDKRGAEAGSVGNEEVKEGGLSQCQECSLLWLTGPGIHTAAMSALIK